MLGGIATTTGIGAAIGVPTIAVSTTFVIGGFANIAAGLSALPQAMMSQGSGSAPNAAPASAAGGKTYRLSGKITVTRTDAEEEEPPKEKEKWIALERASVWDPEHVVDRLRDHFEGRPNKWVEAMRVRP